MASESPQTIFDRAFQQHQAGRLDEAEALYRQLLAEQPNHRVALHLLGLAACQTRRHDMGISLIRQALALNPNWPEALSNLGNALRESGQLDEAIVHLQRAIALKENYPDAHRNLALCFWTKGQFDPAAAAYRWAIDLNPNWHQAYVELGHVLKDKGQLGEAVVAYRQALALKNDVPGVWGHLGNALRDSEQLDAALDAYRYELSLNPSCAGTFNNMGIAIALKGEPDKSIEAFRRSIAIQPDFALPHSNLGKVLSEQGKTDEAIASLRQAIALSPELPDAHHNLGVTLHAKGQIEEAIVECRRALEVRGGHAELHHDLGLLLLLHGDLAQGWPEHEWRARLKGKATPRPSGDRPMWDGASLPDCTLLLYAEQGQGDSIQFIRYAPLAAARVGKVVVVCPPPLRRLFPSVPGVAQWVTTGEPLPKFDAYCPLMSLPMAFGTALENIPTSVPYLWADPTDIERWRERLGRGGDQLKVGLAWAGSSEHMNDRNRSLPLSRLAPLAEVRGVSFYSLQKGEAAQQAKNAPQGMELVDWTDDLKDFADTAALIAALDLVISVDTAVVHLAGALGKLVWTLLPFVPDWRWMLNRPDSPWYPTMRLFRQPAIGDWESVVRAVAQELEAYGAGERL